MAKEMTIKEFQNKLDTFKADYECEYELSEVLDKMRQSLYALKKSPYFKKSNKSFQSAIEEEIKTVEEKLKKDTVTAKTELLVEALKFVWNHPEKTKLLTVKSSVENFWRSEYEKVFTTCFTFEGELGNILETVRSFFEDDGEVYYQIENNKKHKIVITENTSYDEFKKIFLAHFCENPNWFKGFLKEKKDKKSVAA